MSLFLDLTKVNQKTKKPWSEHSYAVLNGLRIELKWVNRQRAEKFEKPDKTCLHWTAGNFTTVYDGYHYNVVWDAAKKEAYVVRMLDWDEKAAHLWKRNTKTVGITLCAMAGSSRPQAKMIITAGILNSEICAWMNIVPTSRVSVPEMRANQKVTQLNPTGRNISVPSCWDHAGYAQVDNYASWRWDCRLKLDYLNREGQEQVLEFLGVEAYDFKNKNVFDLYLDITLKNYKDLKSNTRQFIYDEIIKVS